MKNNDYIINDQIRDSEVRVISEEGEMLGVMPTGTAMQRAEDLGLDLIMISPNANPPVCRIEDFGKFKYEQLRKEKENKKKQKVTEVKEIRFSPNIDTNDFNTKVKRLKLQSDSEVEKWLTEFLPQRSFLKILQTDFQMFLLLKKKQRLKVVR